jgi:hypothetical protein
VAERKRSNGEGSKPRKRPDGRWEARDWSEGKRRSVYGSRRKEVADELAEASVVFIPRMTQVLLLC